MLEELSTWLHWDEDPMLTVISIDWGFGGWCMRNWSLTGVVDSWKFGGDGRSATRVAMQPAISGTAVFIADYGLRARPETEGGRAGGQVFCRLYSQAPPYFSAARKVESVEASDMHFPTDIHYGSTSRCLTRRIIDQR